MHHGSGFAIGARRVERSAGSGPTVVPRRAADPRGGQPPKVTPPPAARGALRPGRVPPRTTVRDLVARHYVELRLLASQLAARLCPGRRVAPRALVREVFLRLSSDHTTFDGRFDFLCTVTRVMQEILADRLRRARDKSTPARAQRVLMRLVDPAMGPPQRLQFEEALDFLMPYARRIVVLRFFDGLPMADVAREMGMTLRTVEREWSRARLRLAYVLTS